MGLSHRRSRRWTAATAALAVLLPGTAAAQEMPDLTLEELMRVTIQRVFGASERLQPVTEAPASVTIVTAEEIRRHGYRSLADVLHSVRGFYVSNDRNYSYVGVRGFGLPGDYNSRILLLLNGHKVNDNIYDQAYLGAELGLDVDVIERVEVIRGPASSLYGTSAFFAVVNVITRSGASMRGVSLQADAGTLGTGRVRGAFGRTFARGVDVAVSGSLEGSQGVERLYFPAFDAPETNHGVAENLDGERVGTLYGRIGVRNLTLTATFGRRHKDVPTGSYDSLFNSQDPRQETTDTRAMVHVQYERSIAQTRLAADVAYDRLHYSGVYPYAGGDEDGTVLVQDDYALGQRWMTGARVTRELPGRQTLTAGGEFLAIVTRKQWYRDRGEPADAFNLDTPSRQGAAYLQNEIRLAPWLLVTGGLRHDRYDRFSRTTPRGAVIVMPTANQSFKYLYGRAFRAPNAYELYYYTDVSDVLRPESMDTHEVVWERYVGEWLRTSASAYRYEARNLISLHADDEGWYGFVNRGVARARGAEFEAEIRTKQGIQILGSYVRQRSRDDSGNLLPNSPEHTSKLRIEGPVWGHGTAAFEVLRLSPRLSATGTTLDSATVAHATVTSRLTAAIDLVASVRNLFDSRYSHPASEEHAFDSLVQNGRTARLGIRWTFGTPRP
jgi:outer membrane receptor for ferrienterochelin and colicins